MQIAAALCIRNRKFPVVGKTLTFTCLVSYSDLVRINTDTRILTELEVVITEVDIST